MAANPAVTEAAPTDEHFVGHLVASKHDVQASEDIVTETGIKLLAKGAKVSADLRERLIAHKLAKPIEQCLEVGDAITARALQPVAEALFDEWPLLRSLHGAGRAGAAADALATLPLTSPVRSLLTLYTELSEDKLKHCVAVALAAAGLARRAVPAHDEGHERLVLTAGLLHDVGELYLDPELLKPGCRLDTTQWKHIVVHPLVGHRVLRDLPGAGPSVAHAVLQHHERCDGFGYPTGLGAEAISLRGEILGAAEWLAGLMRNGRFGHASAITAARLIPGGFRPSIADAITSASAGAASGEGSSADRTGKVLGQLVRVSETIGRFQQLLPWIQGLIDSGSAASALIASNHSRMLQIERSLARSGLAGEEPLVVFERLNVLGDPSLLADLGAIVREIGWRLRELERDTLLQASSLAPDQEQIVRMLVNRLKHQEPEAE